MHKNCVLITYLYIACAMPVKHISFCRDAGKRLVLCLSAVLSLPAAAIWVPNGGGMTPFFQLAILQ